MKPEARVHRRSHTTGPERTCHLTGGGQDVGAGKFNKLVVPREDFPGVEF